jgi:O-antigen/teichoic acid export membrane protein
LPSIRSSLFYSFAERYIAFILQVASVIVLARLLTPEQTGIYSVAVAITGIAHRFRDFGVGVYLIQVKDLTLDRLRTTFTASCCLAFAIAVILFVARGPISILYKEDELQTLLAILAGNFLIVPLGAISLTLLRRELNFRATCMIGLASSSAYALVAVVFAYLGFGAVSMAWASIAGTAATVVGAILLRPLWAAFRPSLRHWREVVRFGGLSTAANIMADLSASAPDLIVGRMLGFHAAGLLSRSSGLVAAFGQFVWGSIGQVALSALAQHLREGRATRDEFIKGMQYVTALGILPRRRDPRRPPCRRHVRRAVA